MVSTRTILEDWLRAGEPARLGSGFFLLWMLSSGRCQQVQIASLPRLVVNDLLPLPLTAYRCVEEDSRR